MVAKQPDPKLHTHSAATSKAADQPLKKTAAKQVTFHDESDREVEILHTKQVEVDVTAVGKTVGDLYGQPQTSLAKQDICREKNCRKRLCSQLRLRKMILSECCVKNMPTDSLARIRLREF
jgi:hypothetical protein